MRVPSKALGITLLALHSLRAPHLEASRQELEFLKDLAGRESHEAAILEISVATGALAAMRPFLADLAALPPSSAWPQASTEWRNRQFAKEPGSARIIAILQAPLRDKPRMLRTALLPPDSVYLS